MSSVSTLLNLKKQKDDRIRLRSSKRWTDFIGVIDGTNQPVFLPVRLNEDADFVTRHDLYHQSWGLQDPRDLLDPNDPDAAILQNLDATFYLLNDRDDATDFPQVFGVYADANANLGGVALTPVPAP